MSIIVGFVEPAHISKFQFDNQIKTFSSYGEGFCLLISHAVFILCKSICWFLRGFFAGYALDPSDDTAHIEEKYVYFRQILGDMTNLHSYQFDTVWNNEEFVVLNRIWSHIFISLIEKSGGL